MKRLWLLALFVAVGSVALTAPTFAQDDDENMGEAKVTASASTDDATEAKLEDVNMALGSLGSRLNDVEKILNLKFNGDLRLRYAFKGQSASVAGAWIPDQSLGRYRARFGVTETIGDFTGKFRIATGSTASPWSQNNTFDQAFSNPSILIDTASLTWVPSFASGMISVTGGKMANPLTKTSITWDPDIQPEGLEVEFKKGDFTFRGTYFELQNQYATPGPNNIDLFMDNVQLEFAPKFDTNTTLGLMAGYEYIPNAATLVKGWGAASVLGKDNTAFGNVVDNAKWNEWDNLEGMIYFKHMIADIPFKWYVHATYDANGNNLPANAAATAYTTYSNQYAWLFGVDVGALANPGDCTGTLYAASLDPNANLAFLIDDDPGETNRQYLFGSFSWLVDKGVTLKLSDWLINREYYGVVAVSNSTLLGSSQNPAWVSYADLILSL